MHIPISFREKSKKTERATNKSPQSVVPQEVGVRAFYYMIRRLSNHFSKIIILRLLANLKATLGIEIKS